MLELPLFQGMSMSDLNEVVATTKLGFEKAPQGKTLFNEGMPYTHILLLTSGALKAVCRADNGSYTLTETIYAPAVIEPERLFGFNQHFMRAYTTLSTCQFVTLSKAEVMHLTSHHEIFVLNMLNIISTQSQRLARQPWRAKPQTIGQKIARFVETHTLRPAGTKVLSIKMETLAHEISESRLNVSRELNRMHIEGMINIARGQITIPALEHLLSSLSG